MISFLQGLRAMGLKDAFNPMKADFSAFSMYERVYLEKGIHKAFVSVDEFGTEASAATAFITTKMGGISFFECNRPFIYLIRDNEMKNILFIGAYKHSPTPSSIIPKTFNYIPDSFMHFDQTKQ